MPGFEINEVSGLNFVREMVEWNLPPVVFESVGTPSFHLAWLRPVGVRHRACGPTSRTRRGARTTRTSARRWTCKFSVLHWYDMTLSVGYAVGFQGGKRAGTEWMISLKIM